MAVQKQDGLHTDIGVSGADLRGKEMLAVKKVNGELVLAGAGDYVEGIVSEGKPEGYHTSINTVGNPILRWIAGAAIAEGALLSSDAQGRAVTGTANVFGRARKAVGAAGEVVECIPGRIDDAVDNT